MNRLRIVFNRFFVLEALHGASGWSYVLYELTAYRGRVRIKRRVRNFSPSALLKNKPKFPFALIIAGQGIISKNYDASSEFVGEITQNSEEFLSVTEALGGKVQLTFMRRQLYAELMQELEKYNLPIVATHISGAKNRSGEVLAAGGEFYNEDLTLRNVLKPSAKGSTLASLAASRLMLPVLVIILAVLVCNFMAGQSLQQRSAEQIYALRQLQKGADARGKQQSEIARFRKEYSYQPRWPYSFVADRIASVLPSQIMLTVLTINPLGKKLQENKPLITERDVVLIRGEAPASLPVTIFADNLRSLEFAHNLQLTAMERDRDNKYIFEIMIRL